jgi:hypothetical protein
MFQTVTKSRKTLSLSSKFLRLGFTWPRVVLLDAATIMSGREHHTPHADAFLPAGGYHRDVSVNDI